MSYSCKEEGANETVIPIRNDQESELFNIKNKDGLPIGNRSDDQNFRQRSRQEWPSRWVYREEAKQEGRKAC